MIKIIKTYRYPLYLNNHQEKNLTKWIEKAKWVYNLLIQQRQKMYYIKKYGSESDYIEAQKEGLRSKGTNAGTFSFNTLHYRQIAIYKEKYPDLKDLPSICLDRIIEQVDQAYKSFYGNIKNKDKNKRGGFETPLEKFPKDNFSLTNKKAYNTKIVPTSPGHALVFGFQKLAPNKGVRGLKIRYYKPVEGRIVQQTITKDGNKWFLCITAEKEISEPIVVLNSVVGIDLGTKRTVQLSNGKYYNLPYDRMEALDGKKKRMQKLLRRKKKGSNNYKKTCLKIAKIHAKIANIRQYHLKMFASNIANMGMETIKVEHLNIKNMTKSAKGTIENPGRNVKQKSGLNKVILNSAPYFFKNFLKQKCKESGSNVEEVNPAYTSQMCSFCGYIDKNNRITQAGFLCLKCGYKINADLNAAINIKKKVAIN